MENRDWVSFKIEVRDRLKSFALDILKFLEMVPEITAGKVINLAESSQPCAKKPPSSSILFNLFNPTQSHSIPSIIKNERL